MTTEISGSNNTKIWRINPYNSREVDWRYNKRGARWQRHSVYMTPLSALAALYELSKEDEDDGD